MNKSFCVYPWIHTFVQTNGDIKLCCVAGDDYLRDSQGRTLSLQHHSLRQVWNSDALRKVRSDMIKGKEIPACNHCYHEEALGSVSTRLEANEEWLRSHEGSSKWRARIRASLADEFKLDDLPIYFDLRPGNLCNLKCRMCTPNYSSLIALDPVHSKWEKEWGVPLEFSTNTRFPQGRAWFEDDSCLTDEILEQIQDICAFYLAGGEPLFNPTVHKLLDLLIREGVAPKVSLQFSTNGTFFPPDFFAKIQEFQRVFFFLSVDGYGADYEYVRYPGRWSTIEKNVQEIISHPKIECTLIPTVQMYNVMNLPKLLKYFDALGIDHYMNILYDPPYLSVRTLPRKAKELARTRLQEYADDSTTENLERIHQLIQEMEQESILPHEEGLHEFMYFTNDLDLTRGQRFHDTYPELYELIVEEVEWIDELGYATPRDLERALAR